MTAGQLPRVTSRYLSSEKGEQRGGCGPCGDADAALDCGIEALTGDRRSVPSLALVADALTRELDRAKLSDDPRARAYADALTDIGN